MSRRAALVLLGVVLVAGLALRLTFFVGLVGWDDLEYREASARLLAGDLVPRSVFGLRWGLTLPLAAAQALGGDSEGVTAIVPLGYSLAAIALAFVLGRRLADARAGLVAAGVLAVLPLEVLAASDVHADLATSVFLALTAALALRGETAEHRAAAWFALAGASFGVAALTKESSLAFAPVLAAWAVSRGWPRTAGVALLGGMAVPVLADALWLRWVTGEWFYRLSPSMTGMHRRHMLMVEPSYTWPLDYVAMLLDPASGHFAELAGLLYLVLAAMLLSLRARTPGVPTVAVWWAALLAAFSLAPHDLTFTRPLFAHFPRTLEPLVMPFALTVGLGFVALRRPLGGAIVLTGFVAVCGAGLWTAHFDSRQWAAVARQAAPLIDRAPRELAVVADPTTAGLLRSLLPARRSTIVGADAVTLAGPALVLRDPLFIASALQHGRTVPAALLAPPARWQRVAAFERPRRPRLRAWMSAAPALAPEAATLWRIDGGERRARLEAPVR